MFDSLHLQELYFMQHWQWIKTPYLNSFMTFLNGFDSFPFYIFAIVCICFAYDHKIGIRLLFVFLLTSYLNQDLKELFGQPRPIHLDPTLGTLHANSFGFPSGAAQSMIVIFGFLSWSSRKWWVWTLSTAFVLLISFSRVYLGVHFPTDILGGWFFGLVVLIAYIYALPYIEAYLKRHSKFQLVLFTLLITAVMWIFSLNRYSEVSTLSALGVSLGVIWSEILKTPKHLLFRFTRPFIAFIGLYVLYLIRSQVLFSFFLASLMPILCGIWISYGVPTLCKRLERVSKIS